jgi:methyl-accepting chemotaxis protein
MECWSSKQKNEASPSSRQTYSAYSLVKGRGHLFKFFKKRLVARIVAIVTLVILVLSSGSLLLQLANIKMATQETISGYNVKIAQNYVKHLNSATYAQFAQDPKKNEQFLSIREELNAFRERIGAMYVYFVKIDSTGTPLMMVDGIMDEQKASDINELTDVPAEAVRQLQKGESASSSIIHNEEYGSYISSYAPILDQKGTLLGVVGIDTSVDVLDIIESDILKSSIPLYAILLLLTLVGIIIVTWFIIRGLRPLHPLKASVNKMANGELAEASQILQGYRLRSEDEIGSTYQIMTHMSNNLNQMVSGMVAGVSATTTLLTATTDKFEQDAQEMKSMNNTIDRSIEQIRQGAYTQKQSAGDSVHAMEEIAKGIIEISDSSTEVLDTAENAIFTAQSGKESMSRMKNQVEHISLVANEVVSKVGILNDYSQEIGGALYTLQNFASQTKLLALNASIEAARAGEHGKGFSVVANEVSKLAEASSESVEIISNLLLGIQQESEQISEQMDMTTQEISEGVSLSSKAEQDFNHVVEAFKIVAGRIEEVSSAAQQISAGTEEATASAQTISQISSHASDQSEQIYCLIQSQTEMFDAIIDISAQFKEQTAAMTIAVGKVKV